MNDLNSIILEGRLVRDPVTGVSKNDSNYTFATIASNRFYKPVKDSDQWTEETTYMDIRSFGEIAITFSDSEKGDKVRVVGRIAMENDKLGFKHHYILAEHIEKKS